ncbi:AraC family transcriptional regulator ligand-binding domain-containing protein [Streptomyces gamaensis]|uniref:AraC family transcriptional regulator ligand-binding domain-containing protein n=1 Tax=Streptomyces gamaensis TaxID=1763542 RepID=A0ABW0ZAX3_9ACTN
MDQPCDSDAYRDSVAVSKFLLASADADGADPYAIAREAGVPGWLLDADDTMIPTRFTLGVWEQTERALGVPHVTLAMAERYRLGDLGLFDYLFAQSRTIGEGFDTSVRYLHSVTTNARLLKVAEDDRETTFAFEHVHGEGRGLELSEQFSTLVLCTRARTVTTDAVRPVRVGLQQAAPRDHRSFLEGYAPHESVDFGMPRTTFTFRTADLARPVPGADPGLAAVLRRYAETLPPPPPATWEGRFRHLVDECLTDGSAALDTVARRLAVSRRTLQRRLTESGTSWRAELDAARRRQAERAAGTTGTTELAGRLGYADPRSLRRAMRRWQEGDEEAEEQRSA